MAFENKSPMEDDIERVLLTEEQLRERVKELGEQISADYVGKDPVLISVLRGSFVFMKSEAKRS